MNFDPVQLRQAAEPRETLLWRGVDAQNHFATLRLVDSMEEHLELERMLESIKPPVPDPLKELHPLLQSPYRYWATHESRFRRANQPGFWYGAEDLRTAVGETGYWRWRFVMDSAGLRREGLISEHRFFQAQVRGLSLDISAEPWADQVGPGAERGDFVEAQQFATAARRGGVQWLRYGSGRYPEGACGVVFDGRALSLPNPMPQQNWVCKVTANQVMWLHDQSRLTLNFAVGYSGVSS